MHKYEDQSVPCGGTDTQGISGSIHTRASVALRPVILEACSTKLSVLAEGGTEMARCNASETVRVVTRSSLTSSVYIHAQREADGQ
jgi:hypothetical protein